jgi:hypothetical protein
MTSSHASETFRKQMDYYAHARIPRGCIDNSRTRTGAPCVHARQRVAGRWPRAVAQSRERSGAALGRAAPRVEARVYFARIQAAVCRTTSPSSPL